VSQVFLTNLCPTSERWGRRCPLATASATLEEVRHAMGQFNQVPSEAEQTWERLDRGGQIPRALVRVGHIVRMAERP
jgi:hypothetical protein